MGSAVGGGPRGGRLRVLSLQPHQDSTRLPTHAHCPHPAPTCPHAHTHAHTPSRRLTQLLVRIIIESYHHAKVEAPPQFQPTGAHIFINTLNENIVASQLKIDSTAFLRWRAQEVNASSSTGMAGGKREEPPPSEQPPSEQAGRGSKRVCTPSRQQMRESSGSSSSSDGEGEVGHTPQRPIDL